ncbi:MAG: hypothetical protein JWL72_4520 [Ilumatobacteraceae bacterium]|nr:hypothetical protein [Ilumatobacteraceae bacterium]MCU1391182.1 hypothetical protein [Ilumatobacteraceae bacterium]
MKHISHSDLATDRDDVGSAGARDRGFTLVEILIAIVLVGILSAVVVVGIGNLTSQGSSSACSASLDASKAGSVVYYASHANAYPADFTALTTAATVNGQTVPAALTLPSGAVVTTYTVKQGSWTLTMTPSAGGAAPTFVCS